MTRIGNDVRTLMEHNVKENLPTGPHVAEVALDAMAFMEARIERQQRHIERLEAMQRRAEEVATWVAPHGVSAIHSKYILTGE